jgi:hypothetical protein
MNRKSHTLATPWLHRSSQLCRRYYKSAKSRFVRVNSLIGSAVDWYTKLSRLATFFFWLVALILLIISLASWRSQFWDVGSNSWFARIVGNGWEFQRGSAMVEQDRLGDQFSSVRYLDQGWKPTDSMWFYTTTQGSDLLPYDFFMVLEKPGTTELFRSNENLNYYRYLVQKATISNPDALPVGFVKDTYKGREFIGFTCAACHTAQLNYNKIGIRIDGGPAAVDMDSFLQDLATAIWAVRTNSSGGQARFIKRVMDRGHYASEGDVVKDLQKNAQRLSLYNIINHSETRYGYSRTDILGRGYNQVLEDVATQEELKEQLNSSVWDLIKNRTLTQTDIDSIVRQQKGGVLSDSKRDHLFLRLSQVLPAKAQLKLSQRLFNRPNAPVSYPFVWEHDYTQWNGSDAISGLSMVGRNACEIVGTFNTLDWTKEPGISLSSWKSWIGGKGIKGSYTSFASSTNVHNVRMIENRLKSLRSPQWPEDVFGPIDGEKKSRGELLFAMYCGSCHERINRDDPNRRSAPHSFGLSEIGTDPEAARNARMSTGFSGILRYQSAPSPVGDIYIGDRAPAATLLTTGTFNMTATPTNKNTLSNLSDELLELTLEYFNGDFTGASRKWAYDPNGSSDPYASLLAYKARSLNGIWATAPYLHNGSVPTLYDLLLPKKRDNDPKDGEYRPDQFQVGSREFDPEKVGLKSSGYNGFTFDTRRVGNSNAGHNYGTELDKEKRLDLLEYLKRL